MLATIVSRSELSEVSEAICHIAKPARFCSRMKLPLASVVDVGQSKTLFEAGKYALKLLVSSKLIRTFEVEL